MARYPGLRGEDVQATLAELTAVTISEQVLLSGGCERLLWYAAAARVTLVNGAPGGAAAGNRGLHHR